MFILIAFNKLVKISEICGKYTSPCLAAKALKIKQEKADRTNHHIVYFIEYWKEENKNDPQQIKMEV